jgi:hypothetical protein
MSMNKFDREGKPITLEQWAQLFENAAYKRVAEATLPDGKWVSTVWLGLDHSFMDEGPPVIFETMVFSSKEDMDELDQRRYSTEAEALAGHHEAVQEWTNKK